MKANRYLLITVVILSSLNIQADATLFGASGSRTPRQSYAPAVKAPAANMRSTSTLMYKGSAAPQAVYAKPSQSVNFNVPSFIKPSSLSRASRGYKSYGGGGGGYGNTGAIFSRRSQSSSATSVSYSMPSIPAPYKSLKSSRRTEAGASSSEAMAMAPVRSQVIRSGSMLSEANADSYYTIYDAEVQEAMRRMRRAVDDDEEDPDIPPEDPPSPWETPVGDVPLALMALLAAGYGWRVARRRKAAEEMAG